MRRAVMNAALLLASTLLSLVFVEMMFSRFFPQPTYAVRFSPWGFEHIPNISFKHTPESYETISHIAYNSEGFRGTDEYALTKDPRTLRVAILGASYAEGAEVDYPYLHGTVLERKLNEHLAGTNGRYRRAEVLKAGVYAYDPCMALRLYEARVQKYAPDIVFVIDGGIPAERVHFCRLEGDTLRYVDLPYTRTQEIARYAIGYAKAKSHLVTFVTRVSRVRLGGPLQLPEQLDRPFVHRAPVVPELVERKRTAARSFSDYLVSDAWRTTDLPTDDKHRLYFAIYERWGRAVSRSDGTLFIAFVDRSPRGVPLAGYAPRLGIASVDLFSYINDHRTRPAHLAKDGHWNEHGHELTGTALFEVVRDHLAQKSK